MKSSPPCQTVRLTALLFAMLAAVWLASGHSAAAQGSADVRFPELSGRVVDQARLLTPEKEAELTTRLEALERDTSDQLVIVTVESLQGLEIEDYGYRLGRAWGIGQAEDDNGVLLIVAPEERKVRIEVGYGLEPVLTDGLSALIIHNEILPAFREGYFERGIDQGAAAIEAQLRLDPTEAQARAAAATAPEAGLPIGPMILIAMIFGLMFIGMIGGLAGGGRRRRGSGVAPILIWAASEALRNSGRGGGGGSSWGGGGFGGGGGSFGGGGASGGW
ncbi:TPM domain-containing protein [Brevundimonas sp.]|uniref:TPM domain-containing protein n=1 Tax=Brevundimonas sp. TaxID=1871086 RepID=UPI002FCB4301